MDRVPPLTWCFSVWPPKVKWCRFFCLEEASFRCFLDQFSWPNGWLSPIACHPFLESLCISGQFRQSGNNFSALQFVRILLANCSQPSATSETLSSWRAVQGNVLKLEEVKYKKKQRTLGSTGGHLQQNTWKSQLRLSVRSSLVPKPTHPRAV